MHHTTTACCPVCGASLPAGAAFGFCPKCSLNGALELLTQAPESTTDAADGFELLETIGRGGMGVVYRAWQRGLGREVAVKMISGGRLASDDERARFRREAEAAARLRHPNIVAVFSVGEMDGLPFMAMEYLPGGSLECSDQQPMPPHAAAAMVRQLAEAIAYSHSQGVLHRDLKPANVLLDERGTPRLTDFGLARFLDAGQTLTFAGSVLGSPAYMAPELAGIGSGGDHAKLATPAVDIYGLGGVLYHLLTGRPPFTGNDVASVLRHAAEDDPVPPAKIHPGVPADLETICLKALAKSPARRYATAAGLAEDLRRFLAGESVLARPPGFFEAKWRSIRRHPVLSIAVGSLAALAIVTASTSVRVSAARREAERRAEETRRSLVRLEVQAGNRRVDEGDVASALPFFVRAMQLDAVDPSRSLLHEMRAAASLQVCHHPYRIWHNDRRVVSVAVSTDGGHVAWATTGPDACLAGVRKGDMSTPEPLRLAHDGAVYWTGFSADSARLLTATENNHVCYWDVADGRRLGGPWPHTGRFFTWRIDMEIPPSLSRDGKLLLTVEPDKAVLRDPATGVVTREVALAGISAATFSRDTHIFGLGTDKGLVRVLDGDTGEPVREDFNAGSGIQRLDFDPAQSRIAVVHGGVHVTVQSLTDHTAAPVRFDHAPGVNYQAVFSADGRRLLTAGFDGTARVTDAQSGAPVFRFEHPGGVRFALWSPQGRSVLTGCWDGSSRIWSTVTGALTRAPMRHGGSVLAGAYELSTQESITGSYDGTVRWWTSWFWRLPAPWKRPPPALPAAAAAVADGLGTKTVRLRDASTGKAAGPQLQHPDAVNSILQANDSYTVATWTGKELRVWNGRDGSLLVPPVRPFEGNFRLTFSHDSKSLLVFAGEGKFCVLPVPVNAAPEIHDAGAGIFDARLFPDGAKMAALSKDRGLVFVDVRAGASAGPPEPLSDARANLLRISPDGRWLASGYSGKGQTSSLIELRDLSATPPRVVTLPHENGLLAFEFSPDSRWLASSNGLSAAFIWESTTGQRLAGPLSHRREISRVSFSADSRLLVSGSIDKDLRVWEVPSGEPVTPPLPQIDPVTDVVFSADGLRLFASTGKAHYTFDFFPAWMDRSRIISLAHLVAGRRLDADDRLVDLSPSELRAALREFPQKK